MLHFLLIWTKLKMFFLFCAEAHHSGQYKTTKDIVWIASPPRTGKLTIATMDLLPSGKLHPRARGTDDQALELIDKLEASSPPAGN